MQQVTKNIKLIGLALIVGICFTATTVSAQPPADDPGIGGPGSPGSGTTGDGGPIVPFDGGMSLMLAASGIAYASKKIKEGGIGIFGNA
jgi:hypothetical protein